MVHSGDCSISFSVTNDKGITDADYREVHPSYLDELTLESGTLDFSCGIFAC